MSPPGEMWKKVHFTFHLTSPAPMTHTSARRTFPLFSTTSFSCATGKTKCPVDVLVYIHTLTASTFCKLLNKMEVILRGPENMLVFSFLVWATRYCTELRQFSAEVAKLFRLFIFLLLDNCHTVQSRSTIQHTKFTLNHFIWVWNLCTILYYQNTM